MTVHRKLFCLCESDTEELVKASAEQSADDLESTYYLYVIFLQTDSHQILSDAWFCAFWHTKFTRSFVLCFLHRGWLDTLCRLDTFLFFVNPYFRKGH